jgi:hypothetical protein
MDKHSSHRSSGPVKVGEVKQKLYTLDIGSVLEDFHLIMFEVKKQNQYLAADWHRQMDLKPEATYKEIVHKLAKAIRKVCKKRGLSFDSHKRLIQIKSSQDLGIILQPICQKLYLEILLTLEDSSSMLISTRDARYRIEQSVSTFPNQEQMYVTTVPKLRDVKKTHSPSTPRKQKRKINSDLVALSPAVPSIPPGKSRPILVSTSSPVNSSTQAIHGTVHGIPLPETAVEGSPKSQTSILSSQVVRSPLSADEADEPTENLFSDSDSGNEKHAKKRKIHKQHQKEIHENGFFIQGDSDNRFRDWLRKHVPYSFENRHKIAIDNLTSVHKAASVQAGWVKKLINLLKAIPHEYNAETGEVIIHCTMCPIHCPPHYTPKRINCVGRPVSSR